MWNTQDRLLTCDELYVFKLSLGEWEYNRRICNHITSNNGSFAHLCSPVFPKRLIPGAPELKLVTHFTHRFVG